MKNQDSQMLQKINDQLMSIRLSLRNLVRLILTTTGIEMKELDDLTTQVAANGDVEKSAVVLINGLAAQITANAANPAALNALAASLKSQADDLAAAVAANTPAAT